MARGEDLEVSDNSYKGEGFAFEDKGVNRGEYCLGSNHELPWAPRDLYYTIVPTRTWILDFFSMTTPASSWAKTISNL